MADISQITLPDGTTYDIKDPVARAAASEAGAGGVFYGTCDTAAATQTKVVTIEDFELFTGVMVAIKFDNVNTATSPKLNISGLGAKNIYSVGTTAVLPYAWKAGEVVLFTYNGTAFVMIEGGIASTTEYGVTKLNSSTSSTSTTEAATPSAVKSAYDLANSKQNALTFDSIPTQNSTNPVTSGGVYTELETVKTSVSNGKSAIASAITDKGVSTSGSDSFATMAENIEAIETDSFDITNWSTFSYTDTYSLTGAVNFYYLNGYYFFIGVKNKARYLVYTSNLSTWNLKTIHSNLSGVTVETDGQCGFIGTTNYTSGISSNYVFNKPTEFTEVNNKSNMYVSFSYQYSAYGMGILVNFYTSSKGYDYCAMSLMDDVVWNSNTPFSSTIYSIYAKYCGGLFFYLGAYVSSSATFSNIRYSGYGDSFTSVSLGVSSLWKRILYGDFNGSSRYIVSSYGTNVSYSTNGTSWTLSTMPSSANWSHIAYGDGIFMIFTSDTNVAAYSKDGGVTWVQFTTPLSNCNGAVYSGQKFVIRSSLSNGVVNFASLTVS